MESDSAADSVTKVTHRVKRGETLFSIAKLYRTHRSALRQWNTISGSAFKVARLTILRGGASATN